MLFLFSSRNENEGDSEDLFVKVQQISTPEERRRAENIQMAVISVGISVFIGLTGQNQFITELSSTPAFSVLVVSSPLFLVGKLITSFVRPFYDRKWLGIIDHLLLPFIFIMASGSLLINSFFAFILPSLPSISPERVLRIIQSSNSKVTLGAVAFVLLTAAVLYSTRVARTMSVIESGTVQKEYTLSSKRGSDGISLRIENPTSSDINAGELKIQIATDDDGIGFDLPSMKSVGEGVWQNRLPIRAGKGKTIELGAYRDGADETAHYDVEIDTYVDDIKQQTHDLTIRL